MSDNGVNEPGAEPPARPPRRVALRAAVRAVGSVAALVAIYYLLPLDHASTATAVTILLIGLIGLIGLIARQVLAIIRSAYPAVRAIEALAVSLPFFLLMFAATYFEMAKVSPGTFTQPLTRTDSLYFTVTVFSTVGFGDITAKAEGARLVVTAQMAADLVIVGLGIRVILGAERPGQQRPSDGRGGATKAAG